MFVTCPDHPSVQFRVGGFCEKCYGEQSMARMLTLDDAINEKVILQAESLIQKILDTDDFVLIERLLGRVMSRFARPTSHTVSGTIRALHLVAPIDFGQRRS